MRVVLAAAVEHLRVLSRDVAQGWTIGRRLSHCDVTIYHYFTVQMADPRLPADIKSKVRAAAATAADTRFRAWRDVTFHQAAAALEKFPHIRRIVGQVAAHPGTHYLCARMHANATAADACTAAVAAWNAGVAARMAAGQPF